MDDDSEKETNEKDKTEINTNNKEKILGFEDIETSNGKQKWSLCITNCLTLCNFVASCMYFTL